MCQITINNLHDDRLNRTLFLLLGTFGSTTHDDGWGFAGKDGKFFKCNLPMYNTSDSGKVLDKYKKKTDSPLLGHIRQASPRVPVTNFNAHPFSDGNIVFVHNGKLTPKKEEDFIMEEDVPDIDDKTGKQATEKDGKLKTKKVSRSDSLIFFEKFVKTFNANSKPGESLDAVFVKSLNETMELFTGKFAMVFIIQGIFYVVRGKTADLYMTFLKKTDKKDSENLGWAINTDSKLLDLSSVLLSNLEQLCGKNPMIFSIPEKLKEETIFRATNNSLEVIGEVKENVVPVNTNYGNYRRNMAWDGGGTNFTQNGGVVIKKESEKLDEAIYDFAKDYFLTIQDIQNLFLAFYDASLLEVTDGMLKHFVNKVIPLIQNLSNKDNRKEIRKALDGIPISSYRYNKDIQYPWMFNPKNTQVRLILADK